MKLVFFIMMMPLSTAMAEKAYPDYYCEDDHGSVFYQEWEDTCVKGADGKVTEGTSNCRGKKCDTICAEKQDELGLECSQVYWDD